jgi:hypothetical protein
MTICLAKHHIRPDRAEGHQHRASELNVEVEVEMGC